MRNIIDKEAGPNKKISGRFWFVCSVIVFGSVIYVFPRHERLFQGNRDVVVTSAAPTTGLNDRNITASVINDSQRDAPVSTQSAVIPQQNNRSIGDFMAGCLLIRDANQRLPEWLAYHYHVFPLRHLIILVDPQSETSPDPILEDWRQFGMSIDVWKEAEDFAFTGDLQQAYMNGVHLPEKNYASKVHQLRQKTFYSACARHFKQLNYSWVAFTDVDEYINFNHKIVPDFAERLHQPGSLLDFLKDVPSKFAERNCLQIPRVLFGAVESSPAKVSKDVPKFLNATDFDTLRYRHRAALNEQIRGNDYPKSILQLQRVHKIPEVVPSVHYVIKACKRAKGNDVPFLVHHYLGSREEYYSRDDPRPCYDDGWETREQVQTVRNDDTIRPWIRGFVDDVGEAMAKRLLARVSRWDTQT